MRAATSKYSDRPGSTKVATAEYPKATVDPSETSVSMLTLAWRAIFSAPLWKFAPTPSQTGRASPSCAYGDHATEAKP